MRNVSRSASVDLIDGRYSLINVRMDFFIGLISVFHSHIEVDERCQMLAERFGHSFCHEEVESRNRLSAMLLILVGLKDDGSQRSIALDALRGADATVLCAETAFKEVIHIILMQVVVFVG